MRAVCGLLVGISLVLCVPTPVQAQSPAPRRGRSGFDAPAAAPMPASRGGVKWDRIQVNYIDVRQLTAFLGAPNFPTEADVFWAMQGGGFGGWMPGMMGGGMPGMMGGMSGMMGMPGAMGGSYGAGPGMIPGAAGGFVPGAAGAAAGPPGSAWFPGTYLLGDPRTNGLIVGRPGP